MIAYPWMSVSEYLMQIAFPTAHPGVSDVQVVEERALPEEVHKYRQKNAQAAAPGITLECGRVVFRYRDGAHALCAAAPCAAGQPGLRPMAVSLAEPKR
jgi:hypothetical protein